MKRYIVELWGGDKVVVTEERAEIIKQILVGKGERPEYLIFNDIAGRDYTVKTEHVVKVKDGRTDLDIMFEQAVENQRRGKDGR